MTYHIARHLTGLRTFVVEDDPLVALDVALSLQDAGAEVFGPFPNCKTALAALDTVHDTVGISVAVLDVDLGSETSEPVARALQKLGVPIVFHTGANWQGLCGYDGIKAEIVQKPSNAQMLVDGVMRSVATPVRKHA